MHKFIITLDVGKRKFFYTIEYFVNGAQRSFSRYFASVFFFDSLKSAQQEFESLTKEEKTYLMFRVKETFQLTEEQMNGYKISIQEIGLSEIIILDTLQQPLI